MTDRYKPGYFEILWGAVMLLGIFGIVVLEIAEMTGVI